MQTALNNGEELVIDIVMMTRQYSFCDSPTSFANAKNLWLMYFY
jgi:hypothetical protein